MKSQLLAALVFVNGAIGGQSLVCSLGQNGGLVCTNLQPGTIATVEWAPSAFGPWTDNWSKFNAVRVETNGTISLSVPMFYRVLGVPRETSPTNPPVDIPTNMAHIPAGAFTMGDTFGDGTDWERPTHVVNVSGFFVDKYEVTLGLWEEVKAWAVTHGYDFEDGGGVGKAANHPVHTIAWSDAVKWCNARSEREGRVPAYYTNAAQTAVYRSGYAKLDNECVKWKAGYRLPTEAEWEKAARGGANGHRFPWTDTDTITHSQANYCSYWLYDGSQPIYSYDLALKQGYHPDYQSGEEPYTSPVGSFAPNGYGLYDMAGNVQEWCWDWLAKNYSNSETDPRGPTTAYSWRTYRGGCWRSSADGIRCADRSGGPGSYPYVDWGFRSVLPQPSQP